VALLISGGLHLAALAVFLILAARSATVEPELVEIRVRVQPPGIVVTTPPSTGAEAVPRPKIDPRSVPQPVDDDRVLKRSLDDILRGIVPKTGIPQDVKVKTGGDGEGDPPPADAGPRMGLDEIREYDDPPVPIFAPEPDYPPIALEAGIEGRVLVEALVGRDGEVREVKIKSGDPILAASASKAVKTWRFKPGRWHGRAVTTWVAVPVHFRIN
jgi:protein TonB